MGRLTLVLSEPMDASRDWTPDFEGLNVMVQKSLRIPIKHRHPSGFEDDGKLIVPFSTLSDLSSLRPDVVIAVEVGARTLQAFMLRKVRRSFKLIVQVRESEVTAMSRGKLRLWLRQFLLPRVDEVFVNGQSGRRHVMDCGVSPMQISVVPSGTDLTLFGEDPRTNQAQPELRLLYVGQLIPRKGIIPFAKVFARMAERSGRSISLSFAGRGPQEAELKRLNWPANVRLAFLGSKTYRDLPSVYSAADAFIMPSLSDEWGLVVNEAMASGLPVLGSVGAQAVEELVQAGKSGWLFDPHDSASLEKSLTELFAASPMQLRKMGDAARNDAIAMSDEFTADAMVVGIRKVLTPDYLGRDIEETVKHRNEVGNLRE